MSERLSFAPSAWPREAAALDGFALRSEGDWLALVDRTSGPDESLSGGLGTPGLWRVVPDGATLARVHDLPRLRGVEEDGNPEGTPSQEALTHLFEWAVATLHGERAPDWTPPPRDEVEDWLAPARLHVRSGALLATGELVHAPGRLALVFPELASVPETLSASRRSWLDGLLLEAQRRWRLARFGTDADTRCVRAEVDLTGVPTVWARSFVQLSLEALAWAVEWVLSPLSFLVDAGATSRALERHSHHSLNRSTKT